MSHRRFALAFASLFLSSAVLAVDTDTPVPYKWGEFKAVPQKKGPPKVIAVPWFSAEGRKRLEKSRAKNDFYQLAHQFQPQLNPVYAGIASSVIVLNALRLPKGLVKSQQEQEIVKPKALGPGAIPFPAYNQVNFLNETTDKVKDRKVIGLANGTPQNQDDKTAFKPGTSLDELHDLLQVYGVSAEPTPASKSPEQGLAEFKKVLHDVLNDENRFLLANFTGQALGASTDGTVSPLAAYDAASDSVLILDVTGHKNPWYWVPAAALYDAMHTQYGPSGIWRGWLVVQEKK